MDFIKMFEAHALQQGLTLDACLKLANVDSSMKSRWQRGETKPSGATIERVLQVRNPEKKKAKRRRAA
jgi:transcriptional regulator with XRE-family HTH domain